MNQHYDEQTWNELYDTVYSYLYRRVYQKQIVEELTSQTLEIFFLKQEQVENPHGFVTGIAKNKLLEYFRTKSKQEISLADLEIESYQDLGYKERMEKLLACAKNQLKSQHWSVVEMCVMCDFQSDRVGQELGLSSSNVRQILKRSLEKLRKECLQAWK
jgi:RNA polymerase sigma factor (sigma-70 family)